MAFGKVVIETEAGTQEIVELEKPVTAIGRQEGNDIVLKTAGVSRYHARFDVAEGQVFLVDLGSVNGTFINDQQVEPNSRNELVEGDVVTMGDVRLIFYPRMIRPTLSLIPDMNLTTKEGVPFTMSLETPLQPVAPSARMRLIMVIENTSEETALYDVGFGGLDPTWVTLNRQQVRLEPGEQGEVVVSIRPPRTSQTRPGIYALTVRVSLNDDQSVGLEAVREIDIVGYAAFGMILQEGRRDGDYQVVMQNQGNVPLGIWLSGYDPRDELRFKFDPSQSDLQPGETKQIKMTVSGGTPDTGRKMPFAVVAHSIDQAGYQAPLIGYHTPGTGREKSSLLGALGLPVLALGAVALLLLVGVALVAVLPRVLDGSLGPAAEVMPETVAVTDTSVGPTPTLFVPPPTLTPTIPPTVTPTPIPLSDLPPDVTLTLVEGADYETVPVTLGFARLVGFSWTLPEGALTPLLLDDLNQSLAVSQDDFAAGQWKVELFRLARQVGYGEHAFRLSYSTVGTLSETLTGALDISAQPCEITDPSQVFGEPRFSETLFPALPNTSVVIIGRYTDPDNDQEWLRIAAYDPNDTNSLAETNHRWVPSSAVLACNDIQPPNFDEYVEIDPLAIPR